MNRERIARELVRLAKELVSADKKDANRSTLSRLLGGRRFSLRLVSFRGFGYDEAYNLRVKDVPTGIMSREEYEANKEVLEAIDYIKKNFTWKGLPIIAG